MSSTGGRRPSASLVAIVAVLAAFMLIPVGYVVATVLEIGWEALAPLIFRPRVGELLLNTVLLLVLGVPATIVLGVGGAWLVERTDLPGSPVLRRTARRPARDPGVRSRATAGRARSRRSTASAAGCS